MSKLPDENDLSEESYQIMAGLELNKILKAHDNFWENEDTQAMLDEVQEMCAEAFGKYITIEDLKKENTNGTN